VAWSTPDETLQNEATARLIAWHFEVEPELLQVFRIISDTEDAPDEPIELLEVNEVNAATFATGSVKPFSFSPSDVPYRTVVSEITPTSWSACAATSFPCQQVVARGG
jgi:hypothetical protein